ncbi:D-2-hydroxyglutarate dehydrogenase [Rhodovulum sp. PH10]|uniref:FAD-binding oxidoreductase n=1 Tax=Rhodovulum sp. PH10 TaxID=1187851 RepID=UPI00027C22DF|nr:FAD-binding oxidoreductase [Rhodovulum sp. PH10]EJW13327.1 D-2-hydroxyglutarate dehydrogenase [Rhodovulum sp. PH10]
MTSPAEDTSSVVPTLPKHLVDRFAAIVGARHALTDPADQAPYLVEPRGRYHGRTPLVLRPGSVDEVSHILALANAERVAVVPQGGNTGLVGGQIAEKGEVVLSLGRLDRIRAVDPTSGTMICEAGVVLANAQKAAAEVDRLFPLSLASEGSCTIGGNLSTNAGGTAALAYGVARDLVLGLEVVLADGRIWHGLDTLKKNNTGYDLKHLFMGAEGTLGVITAAVLKLFPAPRAIETAFVGLASAEDALAFFDLVQERCGGTVTSFELMARIAVEFSVAHGENIRDPLTTPHPWSVLLELSSGTRENLRAAMEDVLERGMERRLVADAALAESLEHRAAFWRLRDFVSEAQKFEGGSIKHDVSVPVAAVPAFIAAASVAVQALVPGCRPVPFGHLGDGNVHFNVSQPVGADTDAYLAGWDAMGEVVHGLVQKFGGSISAEHGIGVMKRAMLARVKDPVALELMRTVKHALDPNGILNPGRVL